MLRNVNDDVVDAAIEETAAGSDSNENGANGYIENAISTTDRSQQQPFSHDAVVTVASFASTTSSTQYPVTFEAVSATGDNDNEVHILTAAEIAVERAAAAQTLVRKSTTARKRKRVQVETKPEPTECMICCDVCTIIGRHRLVALKCGHLFGRKCIERWIKETHKCPNCSAAARCTDICLLFSDHVAVVDNSGLEDMTMKFKEETLKRRTLEKEITTLQTHLEAKINEVSSLNMELLQVKKAFEDAQCMVEQRKIVDAARAVSSATIPAGCVGSLPTIPPRQITTQLMQSQSVLREATLCRRNELQPPIVPTLRPPAEDAFAAAVQKYKPIFDVPLSSARVFSIAQSCSFLCIGEKFGHDSHGVMMVDAQDPRHRLQIPVHSSAVRGICIHPMTSDVLTVAFDGKLAVTNLHQKKVMLEVDFPVGRRHGWSCCFSELDPNAMYCGFHDGTVAKYDMRKPAAGKEGVVQTFSLPERQPVHSIKLFKSSQGQHMEGLAAATFRGLSVWRDVTNIMSEADRPVDNSLNGVAPCYHVPSNQACFSLSSNQLHTEQVVVSLRSMPIKHWVFDLNTVACGQLVPKMELAGHKTATVLSRSAMWSERNGSLVVASWSHDIERVTLWNVATHCEIHGPEPTPLSAANSTLPVVDIQHTVATNDWNAGIALLGTITSRKLCVYRSGT